MKERFTALMNMQYLASKMGMKIEDFNISSIVILSWNKDIIIQLAKRIEAKRIKSWPYRNVVYSGYVKDKQITLAHINIGAAITVASMEDFVACGARTFIGLGYAGSLNKNVPIGSVIIPDAVLAEEGTSQHYGVKGSIIPCRRLMNTICEALEYEEIEIIKGKVWTTDAMYRETIEKIRNYGNIGILGVDMETSAMYAFGQFRGIDVCNILVVTDELYEEWKPAYFDNVVNQRYTDISNALVNMLKNISII